MNELTKRVGSAIGIVVCIIGATLLGYTYFQNIMLAVAAGIFYEWIQTSVGKNAVLGSLCLSAALWCCLFFHVPIFCVLLGALMLSTAIPLFFVIRGGSAAALKRHIIVSLGLMYIFVALCFFIQLYQRMGSTFILWIWLAIWLTDTGGFVVGKLFGKRKFAPKISPGKTWAGFWGGIFAAMIVCFCGWFIWSFDVCQAAALGAMTGVVAVCAHFGDLLESWAKRFFGVKDMGNILPGHGGMADRFDSLLLVSWGILCLSMLGFL